MRHSLPATLYVREDVESEGEMVLLAEPTMSGALPDSDAAAVVGVYELRRVARVRRDVKVLEEQEGG